MAIAAGFETSLALTIRPQVNTFEVRSNTAIGFRSFAGQNYAVESSPNLAAGSWASLPGASLIQGTGQQITVFDTNSPTATPRKFFRLRQF